MRGRRGDDSCMKLFGIKSAVVIRRIGCPDSVHPSPAFGTLSPLRRERGKEHHAFSVAIDASCACWYSAKGSWIVAPSAASNASWFACAS